MKTLKSLLGKSLQLLALTILWLAIATNYAFAQENSPPQTPAVEVPSPLADESPKTQPNPRSQPNAPLEKEVKEVQTSLSPPRKDPELYDYEALEKFNADLFGEGIGN
ncbi:MAG: hypothetical protein SVX43_04830 [Cyanobacteriota bacterium]|nr:hypothetical protein [Cyanobacteriota bacterium]